MNTFRTYIDGVEKIASRLGLSMLQAKVQDRLARQALVAELGELAVHTSLCAVKLNELQLIASEVTNIQMKKSR